MSTLQRPAVEPCRSEETKPVQLNASGLDSTAPEYLREFKASLTADRLVPTRLTVESEFEADCSLSTQKEAERIREHIRVASFLGTPLLVISFEEVANERKVRPALAACAERARREGVTLELDGPLSLES